ncbi:MAG: hypothetical protein ACREJM_04060, partial [Candidatus Saccharimonadales bacterium]
MHADDSPVAHLVQALRQSKLVRFYEQLDTRFGPIHLKELAVAEVGPHREMRVGEREVVNFGFDSFLGLDQHPYVKTALARGAERWGTQFGASRAFAVCQAEKDLEAKIAAWIGTEAALVFPSVTLTNVGVLPGLVEPRDLIV